MAQKMYRGRLPRQGWEFVSEVEASDARWSVFVKPQPSSDWVTVKACAHGRVLGKANYWLSWSGSRIANGCDFGRLAQDRPELLAVVRAALIERECRDLL